MSMWQSQLQFNLSIIVHLIGYVILLGTKNYRLAEFSYWDGKQNWKVIDSQTYIIWLWRKQHHLWVTGSNHMTLKLLGNSRVNVLR